MGVAASVIVAGVMAGTKLKLTVVSAKAREQSRRSMGIPGFGGGEGLGFAVV
jgi:hypothetical protein